MEPAMDMPNVPPDYSLPESDDFPSLPPAPATGGSYRPQTAPATQPTTQPSGTGATRKKVIIQAMNEIQGKNGTFRKYTAMGIPMACFRKDLYPLLDAAQSSQQEIEIEYTVKQVGQYTNYQLVWCTNAPEKPKGFGGGYSKPMFTDKQATALAVATYLQGREPNPDEFVMMFHSVMSLVKE